MFSDLRRRAQKIGQPPGTPLYTGEEKAIVPRITVINYTSHDCYKADGTELAKCLPTPSAEPSTTWVKVEGLNNPTLINDLAKQYNLHPLTVEDILNVEQRSKIEEFSGYCFITLKILLWDKKLLAFSTKQLSLVFGKDFVLSFQEHQSDIFNSILERLQSTPIQQIRQHGSDYLAYRLLDMIIDHYFIVLEALSDQIEEIEELIIQNPTTENSRILYQIKRQILFLRKIIWPIREIISHLLQNEGGLITPFTHLYLRDVYDHTIQAIDTLETFREMISSIVDIYLSSLTNRMNEVMKVLTIIATIFIPITFIASIYGMNFEYMPELHWHFAYPLIVSIMLIIVILMLFYFRRKKWI